MPSPRTGRFGQSTGGFRGYGGPQRGADVTARTTIDFITATKGETITLQILLFAAAVVVTVAISTRTRGKPAPTEAVPPQRDREPPQLAAS